MILRQVLFLCIVSFSFFVSAETGMNESKVKAFAESLGEKVMEAFHQDLTEDEKKERIEKLVYEYWAIKKSLILSANRIWKKMSVTQREEYIDLASRFIISRATAFFSVTKAVPISFTVGEVYKRKKYWLVRTLVKFEGDKKHELTWRTLEDEQGALKVVDVTFGGVSFVLTLKSELKSLTKKEGGIEGLLRYLRENTPLSED